MSDPSRGGRGKKAPYSTTHYRIPDPIKPVVEMLANAYKRLTANDQDTQLLLTKVEDAITNAYYPGNKPGNKYSELDISSLKRYKLHGHEVIRVKDLEAFIKFQK